jgi:hypothetical protein
MIVVGCCGKIGPDVAKALNCWRPRRDLNPCYRRESPETPWRQKYPGDDTCTRISRLNGPKAHRPLPVTDSNVPVSRIVRHRLVTRKFAVALLTKRG